ncbi:uncharacterized protein BT62DRAFT_252026 [Guyanagaster necrorhizus]|uniref:F-box domain-containing protein n=1 Tax=Guyanagaster necrorhizus TaxID=856835 RepID=A0A9P8AQH1_9AGAR|nr:uncharacterized protein BT62DRAFT_252026 [Guyanagaster necrorhizus MCA 3950]KAG7444109.1 hypothetical protein BT62DRAFT_252026 [Guyanagaster necrorhizus MCA 3950]
MADQQLIQILRSTGFLPDSDRSWIQEAIITAEQEITLLNAQIAQLETKRDALTQHASVCRSALSPIRRLPRDMLQEIFSWTCGLGVDREWRAPWLLGQVCGSWRDVMMTSPFLWSTIATPLPGIHPSLLVEALRRSGSHPLSVMLMFKCALSKDKLLDIFFQHSGRWRVMKIDAAGLPGHDIDVLLQRLSVVSGKLPLLEEVYLDVGAKCLLHSTGTFAVAPSLRRVDLRRFVLFQTPIDERHLTHLSATITHISDIEHIMSFPSLVECHLSVHKPIFQSSSPIRFMSERIIRFSTNSTQILDTLTLPMLQELKIVGCRAECGLLTAFLLRSACKLRSLITDTSSGLRLDDLSSVEKLTVHVNRENIVFSLFHQLMCPRVLPEMRELVISIPPNFVMYAKTLADVLRKRMERQTVSLKLLCTDSDNRIIKQLKQCGLDLLESEGLRVDVEYSSLECRLDSPWL